MLITRSRLCDQAYKSRRIAQCRYSQMLILKQDKSCKCSEVCSTSDVSLPIGQHLSIRVLDGPSECLQVAKLRADAFYEDDRSRFVESLKKKFARLEAEGLEERTQPRSPAGVPLCECLVAVDDVGVVGCIDIRLPKLASGQLPFGMPAADSQGAYILNVVVHKEERGRGIGKMLMNAAMIQAVTKWGSANLYTQVAADNDVAYRLYTGCGFKEYRVDAQSFDSSLTLGKLVLLKAVADDICRTESVKNLS